MKARWLYGGLSAAVLIVLVVAALAIPATRRYLANPAGQPAAVGATDVAVVYDGFQGHRYAPSVVQVPVGATVTWAFLDRGADGQEAVEHNVIGTGWGSPVLTSGNWQHTFSNPGTYQYVCSLHAGMNGVVEVVADATAQQKEQAL
ncbi:MAG: copper-binding protein [Roseiflexaceae bacterium]|nr:copper-binding protein [Roseiflexaceae bacterium]